MSSYTSRASTSYKKQDGTLVLSKDKRSVSWTPVAPSNSAPGDLIIAVSNITNLQQTAASSAKVSLKFVVQRPSTSAPENHVFTFTSPTAARAEQVAITDALRKAIEISKARSAEAGTTPGAGTGGDHGQTTAMAIAQAASDGVRTEDGKYSDSSLIKDADLQRSLLNANPQLRQRFNQALSEKPESISISQFSSQFWATRVHLLRAHAADKGQSQGTYNVLSEVKEKRNRDGTPVLNLSREQIQLIFKQHPFVRHIYNENVPKLSESEFWQRFFQSKLKKRLQGITKFDATDSDDALFDKYLGMNEAMDRDRTNQLLGAHVPNFINLEGNEQNHSQQRGNRPDESMRSSSHRDVPILRVLNNMSEKMLAEVAPTDGDPHAPVGMDEETFNELRLQDLQREDHDNRVMLNIKDQKQFLASEKGTGMSAEAAMYAKQNPIKVLASLQQDLRTSSARVSLEGAIGFHEDSDSDDEQQVKSQLRIGSRASRTSATKHILAAVRQHRAQTDDFTSASGSFATVQSSVTGLSPDVFDSLTMTHNTTIEFLHYFWTVFLSGDADRAVELQKLDETLQKSLERIKAVANTAESEREQILEKLNKQAQDYFEKTGRKRRVDPAGVKGGAKAVHAVMAPTIKAVAAARDRYKRVLTEQMAQAQAE